MFVIAVKFKAAEGKEKELLKLLRKTLADVRKYEPNTTMYDLHLKIDDPTVIFLYERYKDKQDWETTHKSAPYIKELMNAFPDYLEGKPEGTLYDVVEVR